jgi:hypothetical protein
MNNNNFENLYYNLCETKLETQNTFDNFNKFFKDFIESNENFKSEKILDLTDQIEKMKENINTSKIRIFIF